MAIFETAAKITAETEGGYGNSSTDLGGETNFGISKRSYPHLDIKNLTLDKALALYRSDFWDKYRIGEIKDQYLANQIFDMIFNLNPIKAVYCIQRALSLIGVLTVLDGILGSDTLNKINGSDPKMLLIAIRNERIKHYLKRITDDRTQLSNITSWLRRALHDYAKTS
jgi:lysozyme family protein